MLYFHFCLFVCLFQAFSFSFVSATIFDCPVFNLQVRHQPRLAGIPVPWAFRVLDLFYSSETFYSESFPGTECCADTP